MREATGRQGRLACTSRLRCHPARARCRGKRLQLESRPQGNCNRVVALNRQLLDHRQVLMPAWILLDTTRDREAEPFVEAGSLKVVRLEDDLVASAGLGLGLDRLHEARAVPLAAQRLGNEKVAHIAAIPPCPA